MIVLHEPFEARQIDLMKLIFALVCLVGEAHFHGQLFALPFALKRQPARAQAATSPAAAKSAATTTRPLFRRTNFRKR